MAHHYDLSGELFKLFLDSDRQYSCAYFSGPGECLEEAQIGKKRHIAAKLFLDANPGAYEVVRRVLGHRSIDTTTCFYTGLETPAAVRHFDKTILHLRRDSSAEGHYSSCSAANSSKLPRKSPIAGFVDSFMEVRFCLGAKSNTVHLTHEIPRLCQDHKLVRRQVQLDAT